MGRGGEREAGKAPRTKSPPAKTRPGSRDTAAARRRQREGVDSPCVDICVLHREEGICIGCYRSAEEIARWPEMTPAQRRALMAALPARACRLKKRRGGRARRIAGARRPGADSPTDG